MNSLYEELDYFKQLLDMLEQQLGRNTEIVLHDLTNEYEHTIIDIRNGHITNRKIGDCGSNLGLQVLSGTIRNGDQYNYISHTRSNLILRSSTMFIRNNKGEVIGSICINENITLKLEFEQYLHENNHYMLYNDNGDEPKEIFVNNVNELLNFLLEQALNTLGKPVTQMDKEDKCRFLEYLDEKGAFVISKAGEKVADFLGISKYTFYNYLDQIRKTQQTRKAE